VFAAATHAVLSANAFENLRSSEFEQIVVTDTIPLRRGAPENITVLSCAELLTNSIRQIFTDGSVSEVFGGENQLFDRLGPPPPAAPRPRRRGAVRDPRHRPAGRPLGAARHRPELPILLDLLAEAEERAGAAVLRPLGARARPGGDPARPAAGARLRRVRGRARAAGRARVRAARGGGG